MRLLTVIASVATVPLVLTGCGGSADDARPQVVASFYPLQFVAARVAGPDAIVTGLTPAGAEPHELELTPRQVSRMSSADLVVYERGLQPSVDAAVEQQAAGHSLDVSTVVPLRRTPGLLEAGGGALDPHAWLVPAHMERYADAIASRLAAADATHAGAYRERAAALRADLRRLDTELRKGLRDCAVRVLVTSHTAFGYLAEAYGLEQVGIAGISPEAEPTGAAIARVQQLVRKRHVRTVYTETLASSAIAASVARDTGATTAVLDPIEGLRDPSQDYLSVMRADLAVLRAGQGCT